MTAGSFRSLGFGATGSCRGLIGSAVLLTVWATALSQDQAAEPPDFSGVWLATSPRSAGGENRPALTPRAQADLDADVTITAPDTFVEPWSRSFTWELDAGGMIFESICDPEDRRF